MKAVRVLTVAGMCAATVAATAESSPAAEVVPSPPSSTASVDNTVVLPDVVGEQHAEPSSDYLAEYRVQQQMAGRASFGLPAERQTVERLMADSATWFEFGMYLAKSELPVVARQIAVQEALTDSQDAIEGIVGVENYGGVYIDHAKGALVTILTKAPSSPDQFRKLFPEGALIETRVVPKSLAELNEIRDRLYDTLNSTARSNGDWQIDGNVVLGTGIDTRNNRLLLRTSGDSKAVANWLRQTAPDAPIAVEHTNAPAEAIGRADPPIMAGSQAHNQIFGALANVCTVGFNVTVPGGTGFITAGHCLTYNGADSRGLPWALGWTANQGAALGPGGPEMSWVDGGSTDVGFVGRQGNTENGYLYTGPRPGTNKAYRNVKGQHNTGQPQGEQVIFSVGNQPGEQSSTVDLQDTDLTYNGHHIFHLGQSHWICAIHHDSGSPVYDLTTTGDVIADGILIASDICTTAGNVWYAQIGNELAATGTTLITVP